MKKINYSKQTVFNYIFGNDIEEFELEDLENDASFMTDVIKTTNDFKLYDFASDEVKQDFEFVRTVIEKYRDNTIFIMNVANTYLAQGEELKTKPEYMEILAMMIEFIKDDDKKLDYSIKALVEYEENMINLHVFKNENEDDKEFVNDFGLGFSYIKDAYEGLPYATKYFAVRLTHNLFYNNEKSINQIISENLKLKDKGINNFIIEYVCMHDSYLSGYLSVNPNILKKFNKEISIDINNYEFYNTSLFDRKIKIIWQEGLEEYNKNSGKYSYLFMQFLDSILYNNKLVEEYEKYSNEKVDTEVIIKKEKLDFMDLMFYTYLEKLVLDLFLNYEISYKDEFEEPTKIYDFPKK